MSAVRPGELYAGKRLDKQKDCMLVSKRMQVSEQKIAKQLAGKCEQQVKKSGDICKIIQIVNTY